jgi:oligo-1,6-glucosidase
LESERDIVLVGETPGTTPDAVQRYTDPANRALDMALVFDHVMLDHGPGGRWDPCPVEIPAMREVIQRWQNALEHPRWPSIYLSNHDQPRVVSRYGNDEAYRFESATALATVFYLQRGTPIVYQGDEIAMANYPIERPEQIVDVESRNAYIYLTEEAGLPRQEALDRVRFSARDNARTPMQWSEAEHAGFIAASAREGDGTAEAHDQAGAGPAVGAGAGPAVGAGAAEPWYPVNPDYRKHNVAEQDRCPPAGAQPAEPSAPGVAERSVLCFFRGLFTLRREHPVLRDGAFALLPVPEDTSLVAYQRYSGQADVEESREHYLVAANLSDRSESWTIPECSPVPRADADEAAAAPHAARPHAGAGGPGTAGWRVLLGNYGDRSAPEPPQDILLRPWECLVLVARRG